jgi:exodeoxyribonuclease-3
MANRYARAFLPKVRDVMAAIKVYSWNVNGFRAALKKDFMDWLQSEKPDILCLQETKAQESDIPAEALAPKGYRSVWHSAQKKGYSGVATFHKVKHTPTAVSVMGNEAFDGEGRVQALEYEDFVVVNAYWPNSQQERARLDYKLDFCKAMQKFADDVVKSGKNVVLCGDFNIAHKDIDLARPKQNRDNPGFYPEECAFMDRFESGGYVDTFRNLHPGVEDQYSWWSYRGRARENNVGWRLDYHWVNEAFVSRIKKAAIHSDIMGSDHCPVSITIK